MTSALLEATAVTRRYAQFVALHDVSFRVDDGETVAIVGPNGAGKSTLVNVLTGLLRPSEGHVRFKGKGIAGVGPVALARLGMARAFQLVEVFPGLTVAETIGVAAVSVAGSRLQALRSFRGDRALRSRITEVAEIFGLQHKLDEVAGTLSQGEKKLLDIASAFALKPEVILLDEPTSGVSTADKHGIMTTLMQAAGRAGVRATLLVEHDMDLVARYATRVVALQEGRKIADLAPDDFFADPHLQSAIIGVHRPVNGDLRVAAAADVGHDAAAGAAR